MFSYLDVFDISCSPCNDLTTSVVWMTSHHSFLTHPFYFENFSRKNKIGEIWRREEERDRISLNFLPNFASIMFTQVPLCSSKCVNGDFTMEIKGEEWRERNGEREERNFEFEKRECLRVYLNTFFYWGQNSHYICLHTVLLVT